MGSRSFPAQFVFSLFAGLLLTGCGFLAQPTLPTPLPEAYIPTVIALTLQAGEAQTGQNLQVTASPGTPTEPQTSPTPTVEGGSPLATPAVASEPPFVAESPVPLSISTPTPNRFPVADIQIFRPGLMSRVVSPIRVNAYLQPGAEGRVWVELFGEDGSLLFREIRRYSALPGARVNLSMEVAFEIAGVAQVGRLVVSVQDEFGRVSALNSVDLILLSEGEEDLNPTDATLQQIVIEQPGPKRLIQGGTVVVSGLARLRNEQNLVAELRNEENQVVGFRLVGVEPPGEDGYGNFLAEVPYTGDKLEPVRLSVYESGGAISEKIYLSSVEILAGP